MSQKYLLKFYMIIFDTVIKNGFPLENSHYISFIKIYLKLQYLLVEMSRQLLPWQACYNMFCVISVPRNSITNSSSRFFSWINDIFSVEKTNECIMVNSVLYFQTNSLLQVSSFAICASPPGTLLTQ